jgi:ferrochelatase
MQRVRVLLAAHGEAESAGWLENFRVSRRTLAHAAEVMHLPGPLRLAICVAGASRKRLKGGPGSAHNDNTRRQAAALQDALADESGVHYLVDPVHASAPPYLEDEIAMPHGVDRQILMSMIPTDSHLSCGLICRSLLAAPVATRERTTVLARLWDAPELIAIHCAHVAEHFRPTTPERGCCLVLVLHGTVVQDPQGREPRFHTGVKEKKAYADALRAALLAMPDRRWQRVEIAYLNHGVGGQWSSPTLPELLDRLASQGVRCVAAYPCEHLVDGTETVQLSERLYDGGFRESHRLPCLNASASFIEFLAARTRAATANPADAWCCEPCPLMGRSARAG